MRRFLFLLVATFAPIDAASAGWQLQASPTTRHLRSVNFDHSTDARVWACGDSGTILYTSNGGITWVQQHSGTTADLHGIVYHEENGCVIAVGAHGTILRTTDRGTTWVSIPSPTTVTLRDASDFRFYAVGDSGTILKSLDGGLTWTVRTSGTTATLRSVIGLEPLPTVVGDGGLILRGDPTGTTWTPRVSGVTHTLRGVPLFLAGLAVGDAGTLVRSTDNGATWNPIASGTSRALHAIADASGAIYAVGEHGLMLKSSDNGATWGHQATPVASHLNGAFFYLFAHAGYAVGDHGVILKTTDGGGPIVTHVGPRESAAGRAPRIDSASSPFRLATTIEFHLPESGAVRLRAFDAAGRSVATRSLGWRAAGSHRIDWPLAHLPAGAYRCQLECGEQSATTRVVRLP